jgi:uncharacterized membrane protein
VTREGRRAARLAAASAATFLIWMGIWQGIATPPETIRPAFAVAMLWVPILPALPMIFLGSRRAATWCSLIGVFYFGFAVMELVANPAAYAWAAAAMLLCLLMIGLQLRLVRLGPKRRG